MSRRDHLEQLRRHAPSVLPSLLLCDFAHLEDEIRRLEDAGVTALHLDVMDGQFVPNLSYGLPVVAAIRRVTDLPLDVHLMIATPGEYVERFDEAGADVLTIHVEALDDPTPVVQEIRRRGMAAGLALNPPTPVSAVEPYLEACDLLLVMSVMPGFGGQAFNPAVLDKLRYLGGRSGELLLEIDGGVNDKTIGECAAAGADLLVAGSAIFAYEDYDERVERLTHQAMAQRVA